MSTNADCPIAQPVGRSSFALPYDLTAEQIVIGTMLAHGALFLRGIMPCMFVCPEHQAIVAAVRRIHRRGQLADVDTVANELPAGSLRDPLYLDHLLAADVGCENIEGPLHVVLNLWKARPEPDASWLKGSSAARGSILINLHAAELDDLADAHAEHAKAALRVGEGELHDFHECRAYELREVSQRFKAAGAAA